MLKWQEGTITEIGGGCIYKNPFGGQYSALGPLQSPTQLDQEAHLESRRRTSDQAELIVESPEAVLDVLFQYRLIAWTPRSCSPSQMWLVVPGSHHRSATSRNRNYLLVSLLAFIVVLKNHANRN